VRHGVAELEIGTESRRETILLVFVVAKHSTGAGLSTWIKKKVYGSVMSVRKRT
jgi:predicted RNase H-related nuclease YkuK (DUF458 family)